jgi:predicted GH43/DUF377 family glycosyl hydrolase
LYASPNAVIANFLQLPGTDRVKNVISRIQRLTAEQVAQMTHELVLDYGKRHRDIESIFTENVGRATVDCQDAINGFSKERKLLLGAYFTKEYSIQAAALFNPSIVKHPNQGNLNAGEQRFVMSLRATGEGHISSIVFKTGIIDDALNIRLDESTGYHTPLKKNSRVMYNKEFIQQRIKDVSPINTSVLNELPEKFTAEELRRQLHNANKGNTAPTLFNELENVLDSNYELEARSIPLSERVIFPTARIESMGMEDVRFVRFEDSGRTVYYGTYTAYNGKKIRTQLIETDDFESFNVRTLYGAAVSDKGMALFPEKVNGNYVMISRQGGEKINIMFSEDMYFWNTFQTLLEPQFAWEFTQLGNCGSPVKTEKGWLLLTHGVGPMRTYVISAILLDLNNPSKVIARLNKPLIQADATEREGYVPNVVYTCGLLFHNNFLIIPYAVSDSATGFVTISLQELLAEMTLNS